MAFKHFLFGITAVVLFGSCYNDTYQNLYVTPNAPDLCDTATNAATYTAVVKPIMTSSCAVTGCHNAATQQSGLDLSTYEGVKAIANSGRLVATTQGGSMPKSPYSLTQCQINQIANWVNRGAANN